MSRHTRIRVPRRVRFGPCAGGFWLVLTIAASVGAQTFPSTAPVQVMFDDYETTTAPRPPDDPLNGSGAIWDEWILPSGAWTDFTYYGGAVPAQVRGGLWGSRCIWEGLTSQNWHGLLMAKQSMEGNFAYDPADWTNIRVDVDLTVTRFGVPGIAWGVHDPDNDGNPDSGYLFTIEQFPTLNQANHGNRAVWKVSRIDGENSSTVVDQGTVDLPSSDAYTKYMVHYRAFRLRLEWYCGNLRVRVQRIYNPPRQPVTFYGCGGSCPSSDPEACWCTLAEWNDGGTSLTPGATGLYHTGMRNGSGQNITLWDNFRVSAWEPTCGSGCDEWSTWAETSSKLIPFKLLYESGLMDYSAGRNVAGRKIDVNTSAPAATSEYNSTTTNYCNGWNLLVDLPAPGLTSDTDDIRAFLQPMATAVDYMADGGGSFYWQDDFDNDPASATYNPVPMIADGATPINNSLLSAFDWYVDQVTVGDWANDPLKACREWYVVLITDGAESCAAPGQFACDSGQAADKFANPGIEGVDPVPVFTIGFSESVSDAPEDLTCISDETGGLYYGAKNAAELSDALYEVFYTLQTDARSFTPFIISPPPSIEATSDGFRDALVVYPIFQAAPKKSLWNGNLYGFRFNRENSSIPNTGSCSIDLSQLVVEEVSGNTWNANERLAEQLAAFDESSPSRFVFMGSEDALGNWERHDLATIPTDTTLRADFETLLDVTGGITHLKTQEIVNFVRGVWMDDDPTASPDPDPSPRPAGTSALGDIYHSQPVIVNPPSRSIYFFDYGFGKSGEEGAHDYPGFMRRHAKRRRVVLAGANDGMLHAFDGGIWDRDRANVDETYHEIHDLGDGSELFAYVPQAVMPNLYTMTYGDEQQYMVDGPIEVSDAFIDHDGDLDREWRTVAIAAMRRGGRGLVALDITQPDPISSAPDYTPVVSDLPGCLDGTTSGCDGEYPKVLWEFTDTADNDMNCDEDLSGDSCSPWWDLGWTWSKPVIARIGVYNSASPNEPDDRFVAFFGGGWDESGFDRTGRYFYGIDVATGTVIVKYWIGVPVPAGVTALDTDDDGFHDRIYFADSDGSVWRLEYPEPNSPTATGAEAGGDGDPGTFTRIWDFRADFVDRQMFFHRPVAVSTLVGDGQQTWAITLGSGNRADLGDVSDAVSQFFFVLDVGDAATRDASYLLPVDHTELDGSYTCATNALNPGAGYYGWYLTLRPNEKVMWEAPVIDGYIEFPTFDPTPGVVAQHNAPDQCGEDPPPDGDDGGGDADPEVVCTTSGLGRTYKLWYQCGLGDYSETNTPISGSAVYTEGSTTKTYFPKIDPDEEPEEHEYEHPGNHTVTNWRQY